MVRHGESEKEVIEEVTKASPALADVFMTAASLGRKDFAHIAAFAAIVASYIAIANELNPDHVDGLADKIKTHVSHRIVWWQQLGLNKMAADLWDLQSPEFPPDDVSRPGPDKPTEEEPPTVTRPDSASPDGSD